MKEVFDFLGNIDWGIVTGLVAIILTIVTIRDQRKHNKLSVKPIAIISIADYENRLAVNLQNQGNGPLIIEKLLIKSDDKEKSSIIDFFETGFEDVVWSTFTVDIDGWSILPGSQRTLIELIGNPSEKKFVDKRNKVRKVLAKLRVEVQYQDIYEKKMSVNTRTLDFFAR